VTESSSLEEMPSVGTRFIRNGLPRWLVVAGGLLITLAGFPAGRAAAADAPAAAPDAQKVSAGAAAVRKGDFSSALKLFNEAYAISQDPKLHYNIAVAYEGLGRLTEAYEEFARFLSEAINVPVEFRAEAQRRKDALRARLSAVRLTDAPAGASVAIDGQLRGRTPLAEELVVLAGKHAITIESPGAATISQSFEAPAGQSIAISAKPAPSPASAVSVPTPATAPPPVAAPPAPVGAPPVVAAKMPETTHAGGGGVRVALAVGGASWVSGVPGSSPASLAFSLEGTARAVQLGEHGALHVGARLAYSPLPDNGATDRFLGVLAEGRFEYLFGDRLLFFGSLAVGPLVISGLGDGSALLRPGVSPQTIGTLYTIDIAPSVGIEYALSDVAALFGSLGGQFAPLKSDWFSDSLAARLELGAGFAVRF
jgi:PEGA domain